MGTKILQITVACSLLLTDDSTLPDEPKSFTQLQYMAEETSFRLVSACITVDTATAKKSDPTVQYTVYRIPDNYCMKYLSSDFSLHTEIKTSKHRAAKTEFITTIR